MTSLQDRLQNLLRHLIGDAALEKLLKHASWLLGAEILATLLSMVQFPIMLRLLGASLYGVLGTVTSWAGLIGQLFTIRVRETIVKYLTEYMADDNPAAALAIVKLTYLIDISLGIFATGLVMLSASIAGPLVVKVPDAPALIRLEALHLLAMTTQGASMAIIMVFDRIRWVSLYNVASTILTFVLVVGMLAGGQAVAGVIWATIIVALLQSALLFRKAWGLLTTQFDTNWLGADLQTIRHQRRPIMVMLFSMNIDALRKVATSKADVVILGWYATPQAVGLYRAAKQLAFYVNRLSNPVYSLIYPEVARLYGTGGIQRLKPFLTHITRLTLATLAVGGAGIALFGSPAIRLLAGPEYTAAIPLFYITATMNIWLVFIWAPGLLLTLGKARDLTLINTFSASVMLVTALILTPLLYETGMAIALVANYLAWTIAIFWYLIQHLNHTHHQQPAKTLDEANP